MRAAVWYGRQNTKVVDVPDAPDPGPGEVKIKVGWTGICGTDLHEYAAGPIWMPIEPHPLTGKAAPLIQGHEFAGIIEEVGAGVVDFKPGDRVTAELGDPLRKMLGLPAPRIQPVRGLRLSGAGPRRGFRSLCHHPGRTRSFTFRRTLSCRRPRFSEPTAVAVHVLRRGRLHAGESVLIIGAGNQGLLQYQLIRHSAASQVFMVELEGHARRSGPQPGRHRVRPSEVDVVAEVQEAHRREWRRPGHRRCRPGETLAWRSQATRTQGRVVEVGIFEKPITFNINDLVLHERELIGILNTGGMIPTAIQFLADGRVDPTPLISNRIDLEDVVEKGFEECIVNKDNNVKVIVNCNHDLWDA